MWHQRQSPARRQAFALHPGPPRIPLLCFSVKWFTVPPLHTLKISLLAPPPSRSLAGRGPGRPSCGLLSPPRPVSAPFSVTSSDTLKVWNQRSAFWPRSELEAASADGHSACGLIRHLPRCPPLCGSFSRPGFLRLLGPPAPLRTLLPHPPQAQAAPRVLKSDPL